MTLASSTRYKKYSPVVSTSAFLVTFPIYDTDDLDVFVDGAQTEAYSVTATFSGGVSTDATVTLTTAVSGVDVEILGARIPRREANYLGNSPQLAENLQRDVDQVTAVQQEQARDFKRSIRFLGSDTEIEALPVSSNVLLGLDAVGAPKLYPISYDVLDPRVRISFDTRADAEAASAVTGSVDFIGVGSLAYEYDAAGTALTTGDGRTWKPAGDAATPEHYATFADFIADLPGKTASLRPGATYSLTAKYAGAPSNTTLYANGATLDFSGIDNGDGDPAGNLLSFAGTPGTPLNISATIEADNGDKTVTLIVATSTAHGRSVGDVVRLSSDDVIDIGHDATNETRGQYAKVKSLLTKLDLTGSVTVVAGETLTQATSGATGVVVNGGSGSTVYVRNSTGTFNTANQMTGSTSGSLGANSVPTVVATDKAFSTHEPLHEALTTNPVMTPINWVSNFRIIGALRIVGPGRRPTAAGFVGLSAGFMRDSDLGTIVTEDVDYQAVARESCYNVRLRELYAVFPEKGTTNGYEQYGDAPKNCSTYCSTGKIVQIGGKHAVAGTANTYPGITRYYRCDHVLAMGTWDGAVISHGNMRDVSLGYVEARNCRYGVSIRTPFWNVDHVHAEDCHTALRFTRDARDCHIGKATGRRLTRGISTFADSTTPWAGIHESRNIRINTWAFEDVSQNAVYVDWSYIPTFTQADAACTGGTTTSITMGAFPAPYEAYNNSGMLTSSVLTFDPDGGGSAVTVDRVVTHTYSGGVNTLTWTTAVGTAPQAGVCTYVLRSYVDDVEIGDGMSKNCLSADVYIKGPIRRMKIGRYSAISDTVQAAACLLVQADANEKIHSLTLGGIKYLNKAVPSGTANVRSLNYEDQISVTDYGAAGDDETDSTTAFQQAHDFANALFAARGGAVHVPAGTYRLNSVSWHPNVSWTGDGRRTTQITSIDNATGHMFHLLARTNGSEQDKNPYPLFAGMTLFGNKANQVGTYSGIYAEPQVNDPNYRIKLTLTGSVTVATGETLTQATSGATGVVQTGGTGTTVYLTSPSGTFNTSNELTGSTSGALGASSVPTAVDTDVDDYRAARLYDVVSSKFTGDGIQFLGGRSAPYLEAVRALNNDGCGVVMNGANDPVIGNRCGFGSNGSYGIQIKSLSGMLMNGVNAWGTTDRTVVSGSVHIRNVTAGAVVGCTFNDKILINSSVSGDFVPIAITGNTFRTNSTTLDAGDTDAFIVIDDVKGVNISGNTAVRHPSTGQWDYFVKMVGTAAATLDYRGVSVADTTNCCFDTALVNDDSKCHYTASYTDTSKLETSDPCYIGNTYLAKSQVVVRRTSNGVAASFQQDSFGSPNFLIDLYSSGRTDLTFGGDGWLELPDASTLYTKFGSTTVLTHTKTSFKIDAALSGTGILGTVSQSGGVPTGAVFETGTGANGRFEKRSDGTMECWHEMAASSGGAATWTFPAAFAEVPRVMVTAISTVSASGQLDAAPSTTAATFSVWNTSNARRADTVHLHAIGRWSTMT